MGTLLSILFLLQLIAFAAITVLYLQWKRSKQLYEEQRELAEQMEQSMALFIDEMKSENANLLSLLDRQRIERKEQRVVQPEPNELQEQSTLDEEERRGGERDVSVRPVVPQVVAARAYNQGQTTPPLDRTSEVVEEEQRFATTTEPEETVDQSFHDRVALLADQGATVESIARALNCGTTEVELSLKFRT